MAYEDGYLPRMEGDVMHIVLPLRCSGALWDNKLDASVSLDTSASSPFVVEKFAEDILSGNHCSQEQHRSPGTVSGGFRYPFV